MAIRRDSLRAQRDFYSPMTGNTGTEIRYAAAPTQTKSKYGSQVKDRLSDIGKGNRRSAPIIEAIKVAVKKTDDPFTQVGQQKSYAPQEENDIGAQIEGIAGAAQDAVSEGVAQAESAVEEYRKSSNQKAAERRAQRQQERQSDLKARKAAADERAALRGDMKKLFARDKKMYGNTVPKGSFGSGSKPGPAVDTNVSRHSVGTSKDQPKKGVGQGSSVAVLGRTTRRQGEKPTGPAVKVTNYRDIRKARLDRREKARQAKKEGTTKAVNASTFKQKNVRGSGIPGKSGKVESARPKQVANLPSNYKATEAKAFAEAKAHKERQARAKAAKAKAQKVKSERARAQAAAAKAKSEGKTKAQQAAAARKAAGPNRTMSDGQQTRAQAGPSARTAAGNRARVKTNARKRAQAAAKRRKANKAKSSARSRTRSRTSRRRRGRRGRRRCDIRCKVNISLLMNMNLLRDDLADVAYFVRELREVEL
jgi:hypothetical protein